MLYNAILLEVLKDHLGWLFTGKLYTTQHVFQLSLWFITIEGSKENQRRGKESRKETGGVQAQDSKIQRPEDLPGALTSVNVQFWHDTWNVVWQYPRLVRLGAGGFCDVVVTR